MALGDSYARGFQIGTAQRSNPILESLGQGSEGALGKLATKGLTGLGFQFDEAKKKEIEMDMLKEGMIPMRAAKPLLKGMDLSPEEVMSFSPPGFGESFISLPFASQLATAKKTARAKEMMQQPAPGMTVQDTLPPGVEGPMAPPRPMTMEEFAFQEPALSYQEKIRHTKAQEAMAVKSQARLDDSAERADRTEERRAKEEADKEARGGLSPSQHAEALASKSTIVNLLNRQPAPFRTREEAEAFLLNPVMKTKGSTRPIPGAKYLDLFNDPDIQKVLERFPQGGGEKAVGRFDPRRMLPGYRGDIPPVGPSLSAPPPGMVGGPDFSRPPASAPRVVRAKDGDIIVHPQTGERMVFRGGAWQKLAP